jgi:hypothetical protein
MSRLTTFSKVLLIGFPTLLIVLMIGMCWSCSTGCNHQPTQNYGYQQPIQPQPQVVYVQQPDGTSVMMNYLLWRSLMDQGGERQVNNYYNNHRNDDEFRPERQEQYRQTYEQEKVQTQKSNGFGTKPVETNKSNGFGSRPVETKKSTGFGSKPVETQRSSGFGSYKPTTSNPSPSTSVSTQKSSGFGSKSSSSSPSKSVSTNKSSGFGKRQ